MIMKNYVSLVVVLTSLMFVPAFAQADTALIEADADNTLIENPAGALSNGYGPALFAGRTNQQMNSIRRAVVRFDVASAIPADAMVESVFLTLYQRKALNGERTLTLHRLKAQWGEGASDSGGGGGAPAQAGDATWLHTFYPDSYWSNEGGKYSKHASASQMVIDAIGYYTWGSTDGMVNDVERWLKHPAKNFGWILIGDEEVSQSVKTFGSREDPDPTLRPVLEVTYTAP